MNMCTMIWNPQTRNYVFAADKMDLFIHFLTESSEKSQIA